MSASSTLMSCLGTIASHRKKAGKLITMDLLCFPVNPAKSESDAVALHAMSSLKERQDTIVWQLKAHKLQNQLYAVRPLSCACHPLIRGQRSTSFTMRSKRALISCVNTLLSPDICCNGPAFADAFAGNAGLLLPPGRRLDTVWAACSLQPATEFRSCLIDHTARASRA